MNVETSNMFSVLSGEEDDQLTLDNCPSSSLDAATTNNTDPSHDSTIGSHDSMPPVPSAITGPPPNHTDRDARTTSDSPSIRQGNGWRSAESLLAKHTVISLCGRTYQTETAMWGDMFYSATTTPYSTSNISITWVTSLASSI